MLLLGLPRRDTLRPPSPSPPSPPPLHCEDSSLLQWGKEDRDNAEQVAATAAAADVPAGSNPSKKTGDAEVSGDGAAVLLERLPQLPQLLLLPPWLRPRPPSIVNAEGMSTPCSRSRRPIAVVVVAVHLPPLLLLLLLLILLSMLRRLL